MGGPIRTIAYVDGFNLYHAVNDLGEDHLKWVDLKVLCGRFLTSSHSLIRVRYCSAYAKWLPSSYRRHERFVAAQPATVEPLMGNFKEKDRRCPNCGHRWKGHEEKETDVNLAVQIVKDAHKGEHDCALIMSADSDLVPAVRVLRADFPQLQVRLVYPVHRNSVDLMKAAQLDTVFRMKRRDLARSLLPASVRTASGRVVARPPEYDPPRHREV